MTTNLNETFAAVQVASRELALLNDDVINQILNAVADAAIAETPFILSENEKTSHGWTKMIRSTIG